MKNINISCSWDLKFDLFHEKQIELYVDTFPQNKIPEDTIRFVVLIEPEDILNLTHQAMYSMKNGHYNYLFTHNDFLVQNCPNAILFEFGTTWIKEYDHSQQKEFSISTLVGGKLLASGHYLRHIVWDRQNEFVKPTRFFISGNYGGIANPNNNPVLGDKKEPLFSSQFHICIENAKKINWFTEKLMDCFQTKTVPIYYGCPNISDWFDTRGMFIVDSVDEAIEVCNSLDEDTYNKMSEFVEKNYEISKKFIKLDERLQKKILETISR